MHSYAYAILNRVGMTPVVIHIHLSLGRETPKEKSMGQAGPSLIGYTCEKVTAHHKSKI